MSEPFRNNVFEFSVTAGTGNLILSGSSGLYRTFFAKFGLNNPFIYGVEDDQLPAFEYGWGHLSANNTLVRDTLIDSSTGSWIDFSNSMKRVFVGVPAEISNKAHTQHTEVFTLTSLEIGLKCVELAQVPLSGSVSLRVGKAGNQIVGVHFVVDAAAKKVDWNGLSLDGKLMAGDVLSVSYAKGIVP